ncbi:hypothetical protein DEU56DRAFT_79907 [Suillus clintonianus]|uniref:uncharacterized protein n=1 Tax=Suillus clintonianus TaxID=1904413 RepID=UPI001B8736B0|nr:uncharacterized protein DEU56DRAFT_79907 [Suillus clintonianus]KAG2148770.1 hypothetical protein DEU56DRAFT_79907 [Suillus clintonianus]
MHLSLCSWAAASTPHIVFAGVTASRSSLSSSISEIVQSRGVPGASGVSGSPGRAHDMFFSFDDLQSVLVKRSELENSCDKGGMASILLSRASHTPLNRQIYESWYSTLQPPLQKELSSFLVFAPQECLSISSTRFVSRSD